MISSFLSMFIIALVAGGVVSGTVFLVAGKFLWALGCFIASGIIMLFVFNFLMVKYGTGWSENRNVETKKIGSEVAT